VERRLVELWTERLGGVPVGATDDFFAAGGTSLQAARLMNRIEQAFGVRLPLATLYADGTPRALARRLAGRADAEPERPNLAVLADTAHPPLVLVHPVGGDLLCYRGLTRALAGRYRVLGLHGDAGGGTLGELARRYVDQVRAAVGGGPYRLAGWSLGGTVAYEMARLLHADGERCGVVLVDPWVYPGGADAEPTTGDLVNAFLVNLVDGAPVPPSAPNRSAAELLEEHRPLLAGSRPDLAGVETEELVELFRRFEANTRALLRHRIEPVDGVPVTVIEAVDGLAGPAGSYLVPLRRVWGTRPGVRYHRVPGNHFTLLSGPALATTAELLTARLP
jgi:thioesterase domain-containing protein/acyl carrier protein